MAACDPAMSFEECELAILRHAVDEAEKIQSKIIIENPQIKRIIRIVEEFIKHRRLVCYGGTAINNLLPAKSQFYDRELELPDYDFYSSNPVQDAKDLADIYYENGFTDVDAKAGVHHGTYKVYVNFMPIADITFLSPPIFEAVSREAVEKKGILYAPVNFLRMSMYLELSRPGGDVSRWEKVLKRLILLNQRYPLKPKHCSRIAVQRPFESKADVDLIFETVRATVAKQKGVFFGGYAAILYSQYMPKRLQRKLRKTPDFDVLSEEPEVLAQEIKERLESSGLKDVRIYEHEGIGELIAPHYELMVGQETIIFIYEPIACHSFNTVTEGGLELRIATIDTMLSFYLAFLYSGRDYYDKDRIVCMAKYLFEVQHNNRLKQEGLLRRFSMECYGKQQTIISLREQKADMYKKLKGKKKTKEYQEWFLNYNPAIEKQRELYRKRRQAVKTPKGLKALRNTTKKKKN
jgi:23S rRNA A2030 N6-methylase RlmJ